MFTPDQYELIDFGRFRRLERFGPLVLDRPCPAASNLPVAKVAVWDRADARFDENPDSGESIGHRGCWKPMTDLGHDYFSEDSQSPAKKSWFIHHSTPDFSLELKGSPFGHLGVFPEQSMNWSLIFEFCRQFFNSCHRAPKILNLFAYSGGSSLATLAGGAEVTHLDAARNIVALAKSNGVRSFGPENRGRWIADDARKFVNRELKRKNFYNGIILDPPTYGHGSRGEVWRFQRDLDPLLRDCLSLLESSADSGFPPSFLLLTFHITGFDAETVKNRCLLPILREQFPKNRQSFQIETSSTTIISSANRTLDAGQQILVSFPFPS